jgi:hypothetical protein
VKDQFESCITTLRCKCRVLSERRKITDLVIEVDELGTSGPIALTRAAVEASTPSVVRFPIGGPCQSEL